MGSIPDYARSFRDAIHRAKRAITVDIQQHKKVSYHSELAECLEFLRYFFESSKNEQQRQIQRQCAILHLCAELAVISYPVQDESAMLPIRKYIAYIVRNLTCAQFDAKMQLVHNSPFMECIDGFIKRSISLIKPWCDVLINMTYYPPTQQRPGAASIRILSDRMNNIIEAIIRINRERQHPLTRPSSLGSVSSNGSSMSSEEYERAFTAAFAVLWNILLLAPVNRRRICLDETLVKIILETSTPEKCRTALGPPITSVLSLITEPPYVHNFSPRALRRINEVLAPLIQVNQPKEILTNVLKSMYFCVQYSTEHQVTVSIYRRYMEQMERDLVLIGRNMEMTRETRGHWIYACEFVQKLRLYSVEYCGALSTPSSSINSTLFDSPSPSSSEENVDFTPPSPSSHPHQSPSCSRRYDERYTESTPKSAKARSALRKRESPSARKAVHFQRQPMGTRVLTDKPIFNSQEVYARPNKHLMNILNRQPPTDSEPSDFYSSVETTSTGLSNNEIAARMRHARVMQLSDSSNMTTTTASSPFDDSSLNVYENHQFFMKGSGYSDYNDGETSDSAMVHTTSSSSNGSSTKSNSTLDHSHFNSTLKAPADPTQDTVGYYENEEVIQSAAENKENTPAEELDATIFMNSSEPRTDDLNTSICVERGSICPQVTSVSSFSVKSEDISPKSECNYKVKESDIEDSPSQCAQMLMDLDLSSTPKSIHTVATIRRTDQFLDPSRPDPTLESSS
ncbi:unnamed protein product [Bursaphelenchus xylophilus]|uniref:(pine wood nematode) hypothetical protein n=1 Tax=Bursaphelenchus xylophilus TaxID=6326 RepID=A0A1I7SA72_BURXY|nr:unnamed protein product [Bursaphelenchus xylophilus]CAG9131867.1 unnamed protein product [Bursaphelenchus xylophilus]